MIAEARGRRPFSIQKSALALGLFAAVMCRPIHAEEKPPAAFLGHVIPIASAAGGPARCAIYLNASEDVRRALIGKAGAEAWLNGKPITIESTQLVRAANSPVEIDAFMVIVTGARRDSAAPPYAVLALTAPPAATWSLGGDRTIVAKGVTFAYSSSELPSESEEEGEYLWFSTVVWKKKGDEKIEVARFKSLGAEPVPFYDVDGDGFPEFLVHTGKYSMALQQVLPNLKVLLEFHVD